MIAKSDSETNSPCQHLKICIVNSMENMKADIRVSRVKRQAYAKPLHANYFDIK